jgi:hypothetical protein
VVSLVYRLINLLYHVLGASVAGMDEGTKNFLISLAAAIVIAGLLFALIFGSEYLQTGHF